MDRPKKKKKNELANYYNRENADVILMNATSINDDISIKLFNYNVHQKKVNSERHAGVAIAIKKNISYQLIYDFQEDLLRIKLNTSKGPIIIFTHYSPPRYDYLPLGEMRSQFQKTIPVYFMGNLNANHTMFGYQQNNNKGRAIKDLINRNIINHLGPDFSTLIGRQGKPDVVLSNKKAYLNIAIEPGKLTTSDHLPLIIRISTKPIIKSIEKRRSFNKANWERY